MLLNRQLIESSRVETVKEDFAWNVKSHNLNIRPTRLLAFKSHTHTHKMKLLESSRFEAINNALSIGSGSSTIFGRIESYSCKMVAADKSLYKRFTSETHGYGPHDLQALSPPQTLADLSPNFHRNNSQSGDEGVILCDTISRKTLFHLIATLNASFEPDYDFSDAKVSEKGEREDMIFNFQKRFAYF